MGKDIHVRRQGRNCWIVIGEGDSSAFSIHSKRNIAVQVATTIAKNQRSSVIIHQTNGQKTKKAPFLRLNTFL